MNMVRKVAHHGNLLRSHGWSPRVEGRALRGAPGKTMDADGDRELDDGIRVPGDHGKLGSSAERRLNRFGSVGRIRGLRRSR